jgi:hypothetical protein
MHDEHDCATSRADIKRLARRPFHGWIWLLYELLVLLTPWTETPRERDLNPDLYVMF